jgi:hydroxymethylbilane synthase
MKDKVVIGTRGSPLALKQTLWVKTKLEELCPGLEVGHEIIKTTGDKFQDRPLPEMGGKGLFTKELEDALLDGRADMAVHSMKDLPTELPPGLSLAAVTEREEPWDAMVTLTGLLIDDLPQNAKVGTSSLRRQAQLLHYRPDFRVFPLRGNLDTRLRKLREQDLDSIVVALAGLKRMGWEAQATQVLTPNISLPSVGQGALGIEIREDDRELSDLLQKLNHGETGIAVTAEREMLNVLQGGCQVPVGGYARIEGNALVLEGMIASVDGRRLVRDMKEGSASDPAGLGKTLASRLKKMGGEEILRELNEDRR